MAALAVSLVAEQKVGFPQAARIAGVAPSEMMDILSEHCE